MEWKLFVNEGLFKMLQGYLEHVLHFADYKAQHIDSKSF